jgi:hypothetical protein
MQPWADPDQALRPAAAEDFLRELSSCLALTAATGMSDQARTEWLITARATLTGIPADLLARGARVARSYCDHPSKIVPTIMREIETSWENRRKSFRREPSSEPKHEEPRQIFDVVTADQIAEIKEEFGIATTPFPDAKKPTGARPKMPTRADYIALGVDPNVLDRIAPPADQAA